jgi:hypothetical protein
LVKPGINCAFIWKFPNKDGGVSKGCGIYFDGKWACLNWPSEWEQGNILKDITYLELIPIALSVYLWVFANGANLLNF